MFSQYHERAWSLREQDNPLWKAALKQDAASYGVDYVTALEELAGLKHFDRMKYYSSKPVDNMGCC